VKYCIKIRSLKSIIILWFGILPYGVFGETSSYTEKPCPEIRRFLPLPAFLEEVSGHCETVEGLWFINDGGNSPTLFFLERKVFRRWRDSGIAIQESDFIGLELPTKNNDWEAIESDGTHLYIGDFGNNLGMRHDLRILKLSVGCVFQFLDSFHRVIQGSNPHYVLNTLEGDSASGTAGFRLWHDLGTARAGYRHVPIPHGRIPIDFIEFTYPQQKKFHNRRLHNYDCEGMFIDSHRLLLFSKNWKSLDCDIYELPKEAGKFEARKIHRFFSGFLVTDVAFDGQQFRLCGYGPSGNQYLATLNATDFKKFERHTLPIKPGQIEGIQWHPETQQLILSTESRKSQKQSLFLLK
jgi:hypothetical protein